MIQPTLCIAHSQEVYACGLVNGLKTKKFKSTTCLSSGVEALQFILEHQPTLAILDIDLPFLSAFDIIKTCSEKNSATKFVVIFPNANHEFNVCAKSLGIARILYMDDTFETIQASLNYLV